MSELVGELTGYLFAIAAWGIFRPRLGFLMLAIYVVAAYATKRGWLA